MTEAVAWLYKKKDGTQVITDDPDYADGTWIPLFTAPPQKEWVGLMDEEIIDIWAGVSTGYDDEINIVHLGKAIEAKLKEKNSV